MMYYRIIDANINRVAEGIRVLDDIARFVYENEDMTSKLRELRHKVRKSYRNINLLQSRDVSNDIGYNISINSILDNKNNIEQVIEGNFKRVQEGLRSIEETLKLVGEYEVSKVYEALRYNSYLLEKEFIPKKNIINTDIYAITGEAFSNGRDTITIVKEMIKADIKVIQYREKEKNKKDKLEQCQLIRKLTKENDVTFIVNDDIDVALAVKADGVHIGRDDMPIEYVRKIAKDMIIGCSTHNPSQALEAVEQGADYIGVGPIYHTKTKQNVEQSDGLDYLKWVSQNLNIPYVAIGGIHLSNIKEVQCHGGKCFAMISEIVSADNISNRVQLIRNKLSEI